MISKLPLSRMIQEQLQCDQVTDAKFFRGGLNRQRFRSRLFVVLASTRRVRSTFSSHCPPSSKQHHWLLFSNIDNFFLWNFFWNAWNQTRAAVSGSKYANHCLPSYNFLPYSGTTDPIVWLSSVSILLQTRAINSVRETCHFLHLVIKLVLLV